MELEKKGSDPVRFEWIVSNDSSYIASILRIHAPKERRCNHFLHPLGLLTVLPPNL